MQNDQVLLLFVLNIMIAFLFLFLRHTLRLIVKFRVKLRNPPLSGSDFCLCVSLHLHAQVFAASTRRAAFLQCLRWGFWCPFLKPSIWKDKEIQLVLHGGATPNPYGVMVYSTETSNTQSPKPVSVSSTLQAMQCLFLFFED